MRRVRTWFVRDLLEAVERERGSSAIERLPARLHAPALLERLKCSGPLDTLGLDDVEELLLTLDTALGDGSGRVLEAAGHDLFSRALSDPGSAFRGTDAIGTLARLRAAFERPFIDQEFIYELTPTESGFSLTLGVPGRPRCAKCLRPLALAAVKAVYRFTGESKPEELRIFAEVLADRALISVFSPRVREQPEPLEPIRVSRRPSRATRTPPEQSLTAEVERILGSSPHSTPPTERS